LIGLVVVLVDSGGVAADRDDVLAATCVSVLERSGRLSDALADDPEIATGGTYTTERQDRREDGRRPSSVGVFRDRCRRPDRLEQLSVLVDVLSSRGGDRNGSRSR
jgi:hypothetical protein